MSELGEQMSVLAQRFIGTIYGIVFALTAFTHFLTFRNVDFFEYAPAIREYVGWINGIFLGVFLCVVILDSDLTSSADWIYEIPKWAIGLGVALVIYLIWYGIEYGGDCFFSKGTCPFIKKSDEFYGVNLAIEALHADRVKATQLITGASLLISGLPTLYFLFRQRPIYFSLPWRR